MHCLFYCLHLPFPRLHRPPSRPTLPLAGVFVMSQKKQMSLSIAPKHCCRNPNLWLWMITKKRFVGWDFVLLSWRQQMGCPHYPCTRLGWEVASWWWGWTMSFTSTPSGGVATPVHLLPPSQQEVLILTWGRSWPQTSALWQRPTWPLWPPPLPWPSRTNPCPTSSPLFPCPVPNTHKLAPQPVNASCGESQAIWRRRAA